MRLPLSVVAAAWACASLARAQSAPAPQASGAPAVPGLEWIRIPGGSFLMGSKRWIYTRPVHRVTVPAFLMSKTLVTVAQYGLCVRAGACEALSPDESCNWGVAGREEHPINCVTWGQASAFARWAGGRLPSEAEWEYAARSAGRRRKYPWGDEPATCDLAVVNVGGPGCGRGSTWPVCSKPKGNTEQGLCDMAGNLWQWTQDWYHHSYAGAPVDGSAWQDGGSTRAYRGGAWINGPARCQSASRRSFDPDDRGDHIGFRLAKSL
jgi:iron(II)-dependent oxidoreductase